MPGVVFGNDAARIEVVGDQPLVDEAERHRAGGGCERLARRRRVADRRFEGDIARPFRPYRRGTAHERGERISHVRQRLPFDHDRFGGVARLFDRVGDDEGDRIADMANAVACQDRIRRHDEIHVRRRSLARKRAELCGLRPGEHQSHARHGARGRHIVDTKARAGLWRAQDDGVQHARRRDIADIAARPAQDRVVFLAGDGLSDAEPGGGHEGSGPIAAAYFQRDVER